MCSNRTPLPKCSCLRVAHRDIHDARGLHHLADANARRARAVHDDPEVPELLAGKLRVVDDPGQRDDGGAPLVVVEDRYVKLGGRYVPSPEPVRRIMAAHWLVPVKAIKEIGLFNEELFPLYGQDDDWCNRARYKGWKIGVVKEARAVHDRAQRQESKDRLIDRNYRSASLVRLADPNRPLWISYLYVCLYTLVKAVKYCSFQPFRLLPSICRIPAKSLHL